MRHLEKDIQRRMCSVVEFCSPLLTVLNVAGFRQIRDEGHHHAHVDPRPNGDGESGQKQSSSRCNASQWEVSLSHGFAGLEQRKGMVRKNKIKGYNDLFSIQG